MKTFFLSLILNCFGFFWFVNQAWKLVGVTIPGLFLAACRYFHPNNYNHKVAAKMEEFSYRILDWNTLLWWTGKQWAPLRSAQIYPDFVSALLEAKLLWVKFPNCFPLKFRLEPPELSPFSKNGNQ